jgi:hypothetical protein
MVEGETVALTMNMRYKLGYTRRLVGQCREFPFIIVEGKNLEELRNNLFYELEIYFNTFPKEGKKILEQYGRTVAVESEQTDKDKEEGWMEKQLEMQILSK